MVITTTHGGYHIHPYYDECGSLESSDYKDPPIVYVGGDLMENKSFWDGSQTCSTLSTSISGGQQRMPDKDHFNGIIEGGDSMKIVRRLIPIECERLQGFPDNWTLLELKEDMTDEEVEEWNNIRRTKATIDGKKYNDQNKTQMLSWYNKMVSSDSHRYQALGNSIATGENSFWMHLVKKISAQYDREVTMGSLFDGIGGFPLIWEQINGEGSCRWASEVEPFCIAVTKERFSHD